MWGILIPFLIGIAFGFLTPGREDKSRLFMKGLLWGVVVAVVVALLGFFFNVNPLGLGDYSFLGLIWAFIVATLLFLLGVWLGDALEGRRTVRGSRRV